MLIVCPRCASSYRIGPTALRPAGRAVRCARCKTVWQASPAAEPTPLLVPEIEPEAAALAARTAIPPAIDNVEPLAARAGARPASPRRSVRGRPPRASMLALVFAAVIAALIAYRPAVVRTLPQTASLFAAIHLPVNLRGLEFSSVTSSASTEQGLEVLLVEGKVLNITHRALGVPRLRFAMRDRAGRELYAWTLPPTTGTLAPDAALPFRTRLASPPGDAVDVVVRFVNGRDIIARWP